VRCKIDWLAALRRVSCARACALAFCGCCIPARHAGLTEPLVRGGAPAPEESDDSDSSDDEGFHKYIGPNRHAPHDVRTGADGDAAAGASELQEQRTDADAVAVAIPNEGAAEQGASGAVAASAGSDGKARSGSASSASTMISNDKDVLVSTTYFQCKVTPRFHICTETARFRLDGSFATDPKP
jgi:hypothetical protein